MRENLRHRLLLLISLIGLIVSALTGLAEHVPWLESLCTNISEGCKDAAVITFFHLPLWLWGTGFYALLSLAIFFLRGRALWLIAGAAGVELTLIWLLIHMHAFCIFCMANLIVVLLLAFLAFDRSRIWQSATLMLSLFIFSLLWISSENHIDLLAAAQTNPGPIEQKDIVAKVGDEIISREDLEKPIAARVHDLEKEIYKIKQEQLNQMLAEILLKKEAAQRGMAVNEFVDNVLLKDVKVSDAEVDQYYKENMARLREWKGTPEELKNRVVGFIDNQKKFKEVMDYTKLIEPKYGVEIYLKEPSLSRVSVNIDGNHFIGPPDAPVVIVEFSDYECPACRKVHEVVKQVRDRYTGRVKWVFKDYPLQKHKHAREAAEAGRCAADQNKFWQFQDLLYTTPEEELTAEKMTQLANGLGMDSNLFKQCLEGGKYKAAVDKDLQDVKDAGVDRTPTFMVNGKPLRGQLTLETFQQAIDQELKAPGQGG